MLLQLLYLLQLLCYVITVLYTILAESPLVWIKNQVSWSSPRVSPEPVKIPHDTTKSKLLMNNRLKHVILSHHHQRAELW